VHVQSPLLAFLAFALYSAGLLVHGLITFRTVPQELESLQKVCKRGHWDRVAVSLAGLNAPIQDMVT
jgi:hypothetical protein